MRLILIAVIGTTVAGCAAVPAAPGGSAEAKNACMSRMYAARARGAVNWLVYENCMREKQ